MNNSVRNFSALNPEKASKNLFYAIANRHIALSVKRSGTKEEHHDTYYLAAVVGAVHFGMKQH